MKWDWKKGLGRVFGRNASEDTTNVSVAQIRATTHRSYNTAEKKQISDIMRDMKLVMGNNLIILDALSRARPRDNMQELPEVVRLRDMLGQGLGAQKSKIEDSYISINASANALERIKDIGPVKAREETAHLPVCAADRDLVIGLAQTLVGTYNIHQTLNKLAQTAEGFFILPDEDAVRKARAHNNDSLPKLSATLVRMTLDTGGAKPSPGAGPSLLHP